MNITFIKKIDSATTRGMLSKAWYNIDGRNYLVKGNSFYDNQIGFEPYSEVMASNIAKVLGFDYVSYELMPSYLFPDVTVFGIKHVSVCENFLSEDAILRPFERYVIEKLGEEPVDTFQAYKMLLPKVPLLKMLVFDAFIGNEDRHTYNFDIICTPYGKESLAPIYDNGISLLAGVKDVDLRAAKYIGKFDRAKPFRTTHKAQMKLVDTILLPRMDNNILYNEIIVSIRPILHVLPTERAEAVEKYLKWRMRYLEKVMG